MSEMGNGTSWSRAHSNNFTVVDPCEVTLAEVYNNQGKPAARIAYMHANGSGGESREFATKELAEAWLEKQLKRYLFGVT